MKEDLIKKIKAIVTKEEIDEDSTRSLMILLRKLLDKISQSNQTDQNSYLTIRLFCNWMAHNEITNSNTGLKILAKINDTLVNIKNSTDEIEIRTKMSQAIGFSVLQKELKSFFKYISIDDVLIFKDNIWAIFLDNLIEIIRDVPLSFPPLSKLGKSKQKIYDQIAKNPIKTGAGVICIKICLIEYPKPIDQIMCLTIITEDTTTFVIPLLIDVRKF